MSNEITSILQTLAPQHKVPGQAQTRGASGQTAVEKPAEPAASQSDRVTLTDSARLLQLAETKQARISALPLNSPQAGKTSQRSDGNIQPASSGLTAPSNAQRPSPAMANMMEAFLTTSDMEGFDANSDLNSDGVINFQDIAALRDIESGAGGVPAETPKAQFHNMTESFFSSEGSKDFNAGSDLNDDGMINFQDLAILRSRMEDS